MNNLAAFALLVLGGNENPCKSDSNNVQQSINLRPYTQLDLISPCFFTVSDHLLVNAISLSTSYLSEHFVLTLQFLQLRLM